MIKLKSRGNLGLCFTKINNIMTKNFEILVKDQLTEKEVRKLVKDDAELHHAYKLEESQIQKCRDWFFRLPKKNRERLGIREQAVVANIVDARFVDIFHDGVNRYPVYRVYGSHQNFDYYYKGGVIELLG